MKVFALIWLSQTVSILGSATTGFALRVWAFQETNLVIIFSLVTFFYAFPGFLASLFAGAITDRGNRVRILVVSDLCAGLATAAIWLLLFNEQFEIWHIYVIVSTISICGAFQYPAYATLTTLLVPRKHLGRANGMVQIGGGFSQTLAPLAAGYLLGSVGLQNIALIDLVSVVIAISILVALPKIGKINSKPEFKLGNQNNAKKGLLNETKEGLRYLVARKELSVLLVYYVLLASINGMSIVLIAPMVLGFGDTVTLGYVSSIAGIGAILGALTMGVWGGPKNKFNGFFGFVILSSILLFLGGMKPNAILVAFASALFLYFGQIYAACHQVIWQTTVPIEFQGRVFAARNMALTATVPVAQVLIAPLADQYFEPLFRTGGALVDSVGSIIGNGPGRGIGFMLVILGILRIVLTIFVFFLPPIRKLSEAELGRCESDPEEKFGTT